MSKFAHNLKPQAPAAATEATADARKPVLDIGHEAPDPAAAGGIKRSLRSFFIFPIP